LGIFDQLFTHLLHDHFYTRLQIFIQIPPTLTKLCHTKTFNYNLLSLLTEQMTSLLTSCYQRLTQTCQLMRFGRWWTFCELGSST